MKTSITLWIPVSLPSDRLQKELSIALWAALTAVTDISIEESKKAYTQVRQSIERKTKLILITTDLLSTTYNLAAKYNEQWLTHFNSCRSYREDNTESFGLLFYNNSDQEDPSSGSIAVTDCDAQIDTQDHVDITIECESIIRVLIKEPARDEETTSRLKAPKPLYLDFLGKHRADFIAPFSSRDCKDFIRSIFKHYPEANKKQLTAWLSRFRQDIDNNFLDKQRLFLEKSTKRDFIPFITRSYDGAADISLYLDAKDNGIEDTILVLLKSDFAGISALNEDYKKNMKVRLKLSETGSEYTYNHHTFRLLIQSNKKVKPPKIITINKSYE